MTELITQRTRHDCCVCALAMFLGVSYEEIVAAGQKLLPDWSPDTPVSFQLMWAVTDFYRKTVLSGRWFMEDAPAMVAVVSPGRPDWHHVVYWDGQSVWDPFEGAPIDLAYMRANAVDFSHAVADLAPLVLERLHYSMAAKVTKGSL